MGYTNSWRILKDFSYGEWETVKEIYQTKIEPNFKGIIEGGLTETEPGFGLEEFEYIKFNGIGASGYEDFIITPFKRDLTQFCKTNRKAYDKAIWEFLIRLECHFPDHITITNDDDPRILAE